MKNIESLTQQYIVECSQIIIKKDNNEAEKLQNRTIAAFENLIPNIKHALERNQHSFEGTVCANYVENIEKLKCKLETFLALGCNYNISSNNKQHSEINIRNTNNNTNENTNENINLDFMFKEVKKSIENNELMTQEEIQEVLQKINEIEDVSKSSEPRNKKWFKLKGVMSWVGTKGVVVAASILNLITAILKA